MLPFMLAPLYRYAELAGRSRRAEYLQFSAAVSLIIFTITTLQVALNAEWLSYVALVVSALTLIPSITVSVRRLHDVGRSGWFLLVYLIPLVGIWPWFVMTFQESQPGTNKHGPSPKAT